MAMVSLNKIRNHITLNQSQSYGGRELSSQPEWSCISICIEAFEICLFRLMKENEGRGMKENEPIVV